MFKISNSKKASIIIIVAIIIISALVGLYETDVFKRDFSVPHILGDDGFTKIVFVKALREEGLRGLVNIERIGAPEVSAQILIAYNDPFVITSLFLLSRVAANETITLISYYVITFVLASLALYWLLTKMKINPIISAVMSLLFSFAPYHFYRGLGHTILISIFTIPLGMAVAFYMLEQSGILDGKLKNNGKNLFNAKNAAICACICGLGSSYYVFFLMMMYAVAFICGLINSPKLFRKGKELLKYCAVQLWAPLLMGLVVVLGQLPRLIYCMVNDIPSNTMERSKYSSEVFSLKLSDFFLPARYHNIKSLGEFTRKFTNESMIRSENATLGLIAGIGIVLLVVFIFYRSKNEEQKTPLYRFFSLMVVIYFMVATSGGIGLLFNVIVTSQFRCYNRVSIVICCIGYITVAMLLQDLFKANKKTATILTCIVLAVGIFDQVPFDPYMKYYSFLKTNHEMYTEYFAEIENSLEPGAMVYQLPYVPYPENGPVNNMRDYSHFLGYYYTNTTRWSYGAIRDIYTGAEDLYVDYGMSFDFLDGILKYGFSGVYINTDAYNDSGKANIIAFYDSLGLEKIVSPDGRLYFYSLEGLRDCRDLFVRRILRDCDGVTDEQVTAIYNSIQDPYDPFLTGDLIYAVLETSPVVQYTPEEYVAFVYDRILERPADDGSIQYWAEIINSGTSYRNMLIRILACNEFTNSWIVETAG